MHLKNWFGNVLRKIIPNICGVGKVWFGLVWFGIVWLGFEMCYVKLFPMVLARFKAD